MFCSKCACELPSVAKFCVKCGTRTHSPVTAGSLPGSFCVNCGKQYDPSYKFCNFCGQAIPHPETQNQRSDTAETVNEPLPQPSTGSALPISPMPPPIQAQPTRAPYAAFTVWYLAALLSCSCAIFTIACGVGGRSIGDIATVVLIVSLVAACVLVVAEGRTWHRIVAIEPANDIALKKRRRRVLVKAIVFAIVFGAISAGVGYVIGQNGAEAAQIKADLSEMQKTGDRISKARTPNGSVTIDWYIQMYKSIEPSVNHLDVVLHRLVNEYPSYGAKFPQKDQTASTVISNFNTGIRRMDLLKKQIDVAKRIEGSDADVQSLVWRTEMIPLFAQEDALDKSK
jgi:hypothetical protein